MVDQQQAIVVENNLQNVDNILLLFKGKTRTTKRPRSPSSPLPFTTTMSTTTTTTTSASADNSEAAVSTEEKQEEEDMARCLILLAQSSNQLINTNNNKANNGITSSLYECKTCNRSFPSFQALGGHRASHKKPKLLNNDHDNVCLTLQMSNNSTTSSTSTHNTNTTSIYTNTNSNNNNIHNNNNNNHHVITKVMKVHECGTCGAEFSSGQALGGHMRRHRPIGAAVKVVSPVEKTVVAAAARSNVMTLDLNLPAPEEEQMQRHFVFPSNDKTLVFTASSLVDCHY